jgi:hypothetical protein
MPKSWRCFLICGAGVVAFLHEPFSMGCVAGGMEGTTADNSDGALQRRVFGACWLLQGRSELDLNATAGIEDAVNRREI